HVTINEVVSKIRGCLKSVLLRQPLFLCYDPTNYPYFGLMSKKQCLLSGNEHQLKIRSPGAAF
ncbi:MAG: hypothetical protein KDD15_31150, partial [Lewinella sp.]|nr:hypothetical protein [Lewinella sp.]